jgi:uncharacterized glyoxalase superfamily protein PhnB
MDELKQGSMDEFEKTNEEILRLVDEWAPRLLALPEETIANRRNSQNRSIKQILGHLIDSASNNTHRIVHLQYQPIPLVFPNYATYGNNDRWIAIQNYQAENWHDMVQLWKYANIHIVHVIRNVDVSKLDNEWIAGPDEMVSLRDMIVSYLDHLKFHLDEIGELAGDAARQRDVEPEKTACGKPAIVPMFNSVGQCEEAIDLYKRAFGAKVDCLFRYSHADKRDWPSPLTDEQARKIYHAEIRICGQRVMLSDDLEQEVKRGTSLSLTVVFESPEQVKAAYEVLKDGGTTIHPIQSRTYSACIGVLVDRFGIGWGLMVE